ncbi:MAG: zinc ribbon domain-containing protein [Eubacterium sp.]|nr:zinc ribbon domain-containing protein [Eubacterium sp.]
MYCVNCGNEYQEGDAFCKNCGAKLKTKASAAQFPQPVSSPQSQQPYYGSSPDYFNFPRILALTGVIIYTVCEFLPIFSYYTDSGYVYDISMTGLSYLCLAIPVLMAYNALFDRGFVIGASLSGVHGGFLKFKLCILFGLAGMCALAVIPSTVMTSEFGSGTVFFHEAYWAAWGGCVLTVIAPFFIRKNDRTGITPVKGIDFLWIITAAALAAFICFRCLDMIYVFSDESNIPDIYTYEGEYDLALEETDSDGSAASSEQTDLGTIANNSETVQDEFINNYDTALISAVEGWLESYPLMTYCTYDINSDGYDDLIFHEYTYYDETDVPSGDSYDILIYAPDENSFSYINSISSDEGIYGSSYGGLYTFYYLNNTDYGYFYWIYNSSTGEMEADEELDSSNNLTCYMVDAPFGDEPAFNVFGDVVIYNEPGYLGGVEIMEENRLVFCQY